MRKTVRSNTWYRTDAPPPDALSLSLRDGAQSTVLVKKGNSRSEPYAVIGELMVLEAADVDEISNLVFSGSKAKRLAFRSSLISRVELSCMDTPFRVTKRSGVWLLQLPPTFDEYLNLLNPRFRKDINNARNRIRREAGDEGGFRLFRGADFSENLVSDARELFVDRLTQKRARFLALENEYWTAIGGRMQRVFAEKGLCLELRIGGHLVSSCAVLVDGSFAELEWLTSDSQFGKLRPTSAMMIMMIEELIAMGVTEANLGHGYYDYKRWFRAELTPTFTFLTYRSRWARLCDVSGRLEQIKQVPAQIRAKIPQERQRKWEIAIRRIRRLRPRRQQ